MQKEPRLPERVRQWMRERGTSKRIGRGHLKRSCVRPTIWTYKRTNNGPFLEFAPQYEVARCFSRNSWYVIASWWDKTAQRDRRRLGRETMFRLLLYSRPMQFKTCCIVLKEHLPITFRILVESYLLSPPSLSLTIFPITIFTISRLLPPLSISKSNHHLFQAVASQD